MGFAFVAAVCCVGGGDVAVAGLQFLVETGFVYDAGPAVVGEGGTYDAVAAHVAVVGAELVEVFAEKCVGLGLGQLNAAAVWVGGLDLVTISNVWPVPGVVHRLEVLYQENGAVVERKVHEVGAHAFDFVDVALEARLQGLRRLASGALARGLYCGQCWESGGCGQFGTARAIRCRGSVVRSGRGEVSTGGLGICRTQKADYGSCA